jgi:cell wall-associated NlpC family hydrolase
MNISPQALQDFTQHVLKDFPSEACGLIVDGNYTPCPNSAPDPSSDFVINPVHYVKASALGTVEAVLHSHPYDKNFDHRWPKEWPSTPDMQSWMKGTVPWGIAATCGEGLTQLVWLDEANPQPLMEREFIHGINDCYSLIRDWYRINKDITLPNFARGIEWWYAGQNLYEENFEKAGFYEINLEEATVGDCVMMKAAAPVTNHAAVIVGPNQILHHLFNRLSGIDSLSKWNRCIVRAVRYGGQQK